MNSEGEREKCYRGLVRQELGMFKKKKEGSFLQYAKLGERY